MLTFVLGGVNADEAAGTSRGCSSSAAPRRRAAGPGLAPNRSAAGATGQTHDCRHRRATGSVRSAHRRGRPRGDAHGDRWRAATCCPRVTRRSAPHPSPHCPDCAEPRDTVALAAADRRPAIRKAGRSKPVVSGPVSDVEGRATRQGPDARRSRDRERQCASPRVTRRRSSHAPSSCTSSPLAESEPVAASLEGRAAPSRSSAARAGASQILRSVESGIVVERETRTLVLKHARPSQIAGRLAQLARTLLEPGDGSAYIEPRFDAVDETRSLIVRARPEDLGAIESLAASIDDATAATRSSACCWSCRSRWLGAHPRRRSNASKWRTCPRAPTCRMTGSARCWSRAMPRPSHATRGLSMSCRVWPPSPSSGCWNSSSSSPARRHRRSTSRRALGGAGPAGGRVSISSAEGSNALVISGSATDVQMVEDIARSLDLEGNKPGAVSVATVQMKHARAEAIAPIVQQLLHRDQTQQFQQFRPGTRVPVAAAEQARTLVPVKVAADRRLNVVVVSGPRESVEVARQVIADLDIDMAQTPQGASRVVRTHLAERRGRRCGPERSGRLPGRWRGHRGRAAAGGASRPREQLAGRPRDRAADRVNRGTGPGPRQSHQRGQPRHAAHQCRPFEGRCADAGRGAAPAAGAARGDEGAGHQRRGTARARQRRQEAGQRCDPVQPRFGAGRRADGARHGLVARGHRDRSDSAAGACRARRGRDHRRRSRDQLADHLRQQPRGRSCGRARGGTAAADARRAALAHRHCPRASMRA